MADETKIEPEAAPAPKHQFTLSIRGSCNEPDKVDAAIVAFVQKLKTEFGCEFADGRMRVMSERTFGVRAEQRQTDAQRRANRPPIAGPRSARPAPMAPPKQPG